MHVEAVFQLMLKQSNTITELIHTENWQLH